MDQIIAIGENYRYIGDIKPLKSSTSAKLITSINLHGNNITKISHLDTCYNLADLDLSSNQISVIEGVESCEGLTRLNLSCNQLRRLSGLNFLYNLVTLNLSYNKIENIKNLSHFSGAQFHLEHLLLHGNQLRSVPLTTSTLKRISTLRTLTVHTNPLCDNKSYRRVITNCMPHLVTIDDCDTKEDSFSSQSTDITAQLVKTPAIDKALRHYQHPDLSMSPHREHLSSRESPQSDCSPSSMESPVAPVDYTELVKQVLSMIKDEQQPVKLDKELATEEGCNEGPEVAAAQQDLESSKKRAEDLESLYSTNKLLLAELEAERERRWKSDAHIVELSDRLTQNKQSLRSYEELNASSEAGINGIREMLALERGQKAKLANLLEAFKEKHTDVIKHLSQKERHIAQREGEILDMKGRLETMRRAAAEQQNSGKLHLANAKQEAQVQRKQCELLRHEVTAHSVQVKTLQELVIKREQEHLTEKQGLVNINGEEVREKVREGVRNEKEKSDLCNKNVLESLEQSLAKYQKLEKEFRVALYLENKRYEEVHSAFTKVSSANKLELVALTEGDERNVSLIKKLKKSVEEQSEYIQQLRRSKKAESESTITRLTVLERELEESVCKVQELSSLQAQNDSLRAEHSAQSSVIEGLRAERGLWSKELAQQGAELSQDRGKMQCEMGSLSTQLKEASLQATTCKDALRIKECQVTDAMETISKLKEALVESEVQCEERMEQMQSIVSRATEDLDLSEARTEAVKEVLKQAESERDQDMECIEKQQQDHAKLKQGYKELKLQWKEKVEMLNQLESSIQQVTSVHKAQLSELQHELEHSKVKVKQSEVLVQEEREQCQQRLEKQASEHGAVLQSLQTEHETLVQSLREQIKALETEMRLVLHQSQQQKVDNEAKMSRLAGALGEFTQFLKPA